MNAAKSIARRAAIVARKMQFAPRRVKVGIGPHIHDVPRDQLPVDGHSRMRINHYHTPHQGNRECARRARQMAKAAQS